MTSLLSKPLYKNARQELLVVPFAKPLILCIEDNPMYLELRKKVLEKDGYNVIGVTCAGDALEAVLDTPVCCIIADHMLQGRTGVELAKEMKKMKPDVPIILFSGNIPLQLSNIDVYVNKGETTEEFLKIVHGVIERYCS
jgi:CheY-like chemotaxis protein